MSTTKIRRTAGRLETDRQWQLIMSLSLLVGFSTFDAAGIADGTTPGNLQTAASVDYRIEGVAYTKAATDDLWDLSAETDTGEDEYRAYWLLLDDAGAATIDAGAARTSAADALAALPALDGTKAVVGVYVAGPETDFDAAGGLAAQGDIHDGIPEGVRLQGLAEHRYVTPKVIELTGF